MQWRGSTGLGAGRLIRTLIPSLFDAAGIGEDRIQTRPFGISDRLSAPTSKP